MEELALSRQSPLEKECKGRTTYSNDSKISESGGLLSKTDLLTTDD
jgi:hypothetical protein